MDLGREDQELEVCEQMKLLQPKYSQKGKKKKFLFLCGFISVLNGFAQFHNEYASLYQKLKVRSVTAWYYFYDKQIPTDSTEFSTTYLNRFGMPDSAGNWNGDVFVKEFKCRYDQLGNQVFIQFYDHSVRPGSIHRTLYYTYNDTLLIRSVELDGRNDTVFKSAYFYSEGKPVKTIYDTYMGSHAKRIYRYDEYGNNIAIENYSDGKMQHSTQKTYDSRHQLLEELSSDFKEKTGYRRRLTYDADGDVIEDLYEDYPENGKLRTQKQTNVYQIIRGKKRVVAMHSTWFGRLKKSKYVYRFNADETVRLIEKSKIKYPGFFSWIGKNEKQNCTTLFSYDTLHAQVRCTQGKDLHLTWYSKQQVIKEMELSSKGDTLNFFEKQFSPNGLPVEEKTIAYRYSNHRHKRLLERQTERTRYIYRYLDEAEKP